MRVKAVRVGACAISKRVRSVNRVARARCNWGLRRRKTKMKTPDEGARLGDWIGTIDGRRQNMSIATVILILCLVAGAHLAVWGLAEPRTAAAQVEGKLPSVSYNR